MLDRSHYKIDTKSTARSSAKRLLRIFFFFFLITSIGNVKAFSKNLIEQHFYSELTFYDLTLGHLHWSRIIVSFAVENKTAQRSTRLRFYLSAQQKFFSCCFLLLFLMDVWIFWFFLKGVSDFFYIFFFKFLFFFFSHSQFYL